MKKGFIILTLLTTLCIVGCKKKTKKPTTKPNTDVITTTEKPTTNGHTTTDAPTTTEPVIPVKNDLEYTGNIEYSIDYPEYYDEDTNTYKLTTSEYNGLEDLFAVRLDLDYNQIKSASIDGVAVRLGGNDSSTTIFVDKISNIEKNRLYQMNDLEIIFKDDYDYAKTNISIDKKLFVRDSYITTEAYCNLSPVINNEYDTNLDLLLEPAVGGPRAGVLSAGGNLS